MAPDIDWELQERGLAVLDAAASTFGEKRFASGQIQQVPRPTLHLYAVNPTQPEITALDRAAGKAGYRLTVTSVRYSYAELLTFYERLAGENLPGDACAFYGVDAAANALVFTLRRLDDEVVSQSTNGCRRTRSASPWSHEHLTPSPYSSMSTHALRRGVALIWILASGRGGERSRLNM